MEQAAEELSLDEPIDARHQHEMHADASADAICEPGALPNDPLGRICANPLRDEPDPGEIRTVRRFGLVGLVAIALRAAVARWWKSTIH